MDFFTADLHLGHEAIIEYESRPFRTIEEHDEQLIQRWNDVVKRTDTVYVLGDLALGHRPQIINTIHKLHGSIHLIRGNHDSNNVDRPSVRERFASIEDIRLYRGISEGRKIRIVLCHYPMMFWEGSDRGYWHLHGHCHGSAPTRSALAIDIGCMLSDYRPVPLPTIVQMFKALEASGYGPTNHHAVTEEDE